MLKSRFAGVLLLCASLAGAGCSTLRELPRSEYAARPQRPRVRVETTEGLVYEFDYAHVDEDTLTGYRERDVEGPITEVSTVRLPLDGVRKLSIHEIDWYRTGLVGGAALAAVVAGGLSAIHRNSGGDKTATGGAGKVGDQ